MAAFSLLKCLVRCIARQRIYEAHCSCLKAQAFTSEKFTRAEPGFNLHKYVLEGQVSLYLKVFRVLVQERQTVRRRKRTTV